METKIKYFEGLDAVFFKAGPVIDVIPLSPKMSDKDQVIVPEQTKLRLPKLVTPYEVKISCSEFSDSASIEILFDYENKRSELEYSQSFVILIVDTVTNVDLDEWPIMRGVPCAITVKVKEGTVENPYAVLRSRLEKK